MSASTRKISQSTSTAPVVTAAKAVNTTDSAVRITHLPTGLVVTCQDERSQQQNRMRALAVLRARVLEMEQRKQQEEETAMRRGLVGTGERSEKIRTYNFPQNRVTDHRISLTIYNLDQLMDGNVEGIVDALTTTYESERLAAAGFEELSYWNATVVVSSATKAPAIGKDEAAASPQPLPPIVNAVAFASGSLQSSSQQDVLHWASQQLRGSGIDSHARDARILLRHVLGCTEEDLAGGRADLISADHVSTLQGLILRRQQGETRRLYHRQERVHGVGVRGKYSRRVAYSPAGNGTAC